MRYDAFISYSHAADSQLAPRLQDGMQRMARPWWRRRALHLFRDNTGLTANPGLWTSIATAMDDSEWFVFLASPEAAASPWVQREIEHWLERRDVDHILPVVTDGEWVWDDATNDFDRARSTAVPVALFGAFNEEPRHIDMRWAHTEEQVDLRHPAFRDDVAAVAAPMHGLAKDELVGEDVRQHRRTMRYAWGAAAALVLLTLGSVLAGALAVRNANAAESAKNEADANASEADQQKAIADANADEAAANATEALANSERAEANAAEAMSQQQLAEQNATEASQQRTAAESSALEAQVQATEAARQARAALDARDAESAAKADAELQAQNALRAQAEAVVEKENAQRQEQIANEQRVAAETSAANETIARQAAEASEQAAQDAQQQAETQALASQSAAQLDEDTALSLLLAIEANNRGEPGAQALAASGGQSLQALSGYSPVGRRALFEAVTEARGSAKKVPVDRFLPLPPDTVDPPSFLWRPALSPNGRWLAAAESTNPSNDPTKPFQARVFVWDLDHPGSPVKVLRGHERSIFYLAFAGDDTLVTMNMTEDVFTTPHTTIVWDLTTSTAALTRHATPHIAPGGKVIALQAATLDVEFVDAATRTVTARQDGYLSTDANSTPGPISPSTFGWLEKPFSRDGRFAMGVTDDGVAVLWDLETGGRRVIPLITTDGFTSDAPSVDPTGTLATAIVDGWQLAFFRTSDGVEVDRWYIAPGLTEIALSTVWSPDGSRFAVLVWDFATNVERVVVAVPGQGSWEATLPGGCGDAVFTLAPCRIGFTRWGNHLTVETPGEGLAMTTYVVESTTGDILDIVDGEVITDARADGSLLFAQHLDPATRRPTLLIDDLRLGRTVLAESSDPAVDALDRTAIVVSLDRANERLAVATADGAVRTWDLLDATDASAMAGPSRLYLGLVFDDRAPKLVGVGIGATTTLWDHSNEGSADRIGVTDPSAAMLADGRTVAEPTAGRDGVVLRDLETDQTRPGPTLEPGDTVENVVAGTNGPLAVNLVGGSAVVADLDGNNLGRVDGPVRAASLDGSTFAVRKPNRLIDVVETAGLGVRRTIDLAPLPDPGLPTTPVGDIEEVLAFDPDGARFAATNATGEVVVWDVRTGNVVAHLPGTPIDRNAVPFAGLAFSPTGDRLVSKSPSNLVRLWDTGNWSLVTNEQLQNDELAGRVAFSPDGALVAVDGLFVLDGSTLEVVADLAFETTSGLRFTADGRSLLVLRDDGVILRWAVAVDELVDRACSLAGRNLTRTEWARYLPNVGYRATCAAFPIEP